MTKPPPTSTVDSISDQPPSLDEISAHCFGCGPRNPQGLHLHFTLDAATHTTSAPLQLTEMHQGAPGFIHGGIIATLLDEAMSKLNRPLGLIAMTRHIEVDYLRPAPIHTPLTVSARHLRREGRKLFHLAELHDRDGNLLATSTALWIVIDPSLIPEAIRAHIPPDQIEPA